MLRRLPLRLCRFRQACRATCTLAASIIAYLILLVELADGDTFTGLVLLWIGAPSPLRRINLATVRAFLTTTGAIYHRLFCLRWRLVVRRKVFTLPRPSHVELRLGKVDLDPEHFVLKELSRPDSLRNLLQCLF